MSDQKYPEPDQTTDMFTKDLFENVFVQPRVAARLFEQDLVGFKRFREVIDPSIAATLIQGLGLFYISKRYYCPKSGPTTICLTRTRMRFYATLG